MNTVKLTNQTREVLKNYATINGSILIREGSQLKTINVGENLISQYNCKEVFPQTFAIYDLDQFLAGLSLFTDPELEFDNDDYLTIRGEGRSAKYYFSDPEITLKTAPDRKVNFPGADIEFSITGGTVLGSSGQLEALRRAANVYGIPDLVFKSSLDGTVWLNLCDKENETSNVYSQEIQGKSTGEYELSMKMEHVNLVPGNYEVKISSKLITQWKHSSLPLVYYIALEPQ
jgi:hypothetical protein